MYGQWVPAGILEIQALLWVLGASNDNASKRKVFKFQSQQASLMDVLHHKDGMESVKELLH